MMFRAWNSSTKSLFGFWSLEQGACSIASRTTDLYSFSLESLSTCRQLVPCWQWMRLTPRGFLREKPCWGVCTNMDCWTRDKTSWIMYWLSHLKISWRGALRHVSSKLALQSQSIMLESSFAKDTSGKSHPFLSQNMYRTLTSWS